jgi:regulator of cell morphogenesis and NO signaling
LHALCERVTAARKWQNPELIDLARKLRRLSGDLTFHMSHTESKVFPYIEALERSRKDGTPLALSFAAQAESLIQEVMVGHTPAGDMLRQIETDTNRFAPPEDACPDMIGLYQGLRELARRRSNHIQLEGYVLFPRALALEQEVLAA